jgi:DNA polymerase III subunit delta'
LAGHLLSVSESHSQREDVGSKMAFTPETALKYLKRALEQDRLAHAYLITGASGSGKEALALELARAVNNSKSPNGSGVFKVNPESKSRRIVVEQVRELEHSLHMRATEGRRKIAIISEADRLQPQAANAFLKTLEEPPSDSLLLLLSALPEVLPDTIRSRCIGIPLAGKQPADATDEERELVALLQKIAREKKDGVQSAYRLAQGLQSLLRKIREEIQEENAAAQKRDETRYKNTTDGAWLEDREDYYKALNESLYLQRRARLLETFFLWWSDVLRASTGIGRRDLPAAKKETELWAKRLTTPEILRRLRRLEELRDHLGRNIQEALAFEVAFLRVFAC